MPRPQFHHTKLMILTVCLLSTTLFQPLRLNAIEPLTLTAVALVATTLSVITTLFDSGSDLTLTIAGQNRELLLDNRKILIDINERFNRFGRALEGALHKLDALPPIIRREMRSAIDEFQQNKVLATVQLIVGDRAIQKAGGMLVTDPRDRLRTLQQESRTLFQRGDLNTPVLMVAMAYELALLMAMDASPQEIAGRRQEYADRLLRISDTERQGSLAHQHGTLMRSMTRMIDRHRSALGRQVGLYEKKDFGNPGDCLGGWRYDGCHNYFGNCERYSREEARQAQHQLLQDVSSDSDRFEVYVDLSNALTNIVGNVQMTLGSETRRPPILSKMKADLKRLVRGWNKIQQEIKEYGRLKIVDHYGFVSSSRPDRRRRPCEHRL